MNRDETSMIVLSRAIVIVLVILITLISFTTGYLVGRYSREPSMEKKEESVAHAPEPLEKTSQDTATVTPSEATVETQVVSEAGITREHEVKGNKKLREEEVKKENTSILEEGRFYLQVGAFKDHSKALKLKARIKDSFNNVIIIKEGHVSKVMVGAYSDKKEAMIAATRIKNLYKIDSLIIKK